MPVDWRLGLQQGNPGEAFVNAFQQGTQAREQNMAKAAMAALVQDPTNQKALEALASVNPQAAQQFQQQRIEQVKAHLAEHQESIMKGAQLIRQMQPKDDASWQQVRAIAAQAGIDVTQVPEHFDEQYVNGIVHLADAFHPQPADGMKYIPLQQGGSVAAVNPHTNTAQIMIAPNDGSHPTGAPVAGQPPAEAVARLQANPHEAQQFDEVFGPGSAARVLGGQTAPAPSGGFPQHY